MAIKVLFRDSDKAYVVCTRYYADGAESTDQEIVDILNQSLKDSFGLDNNLANWAVATISAATWTTNAYGEKIDYVYVDSTSITASDPPETYYYDISTDAVDSGPPYDNMPDIPADGTSTCTITVTKKKGSDNTTDTGATDSIWFETSGGKLSTQNTAMVSGVATTVLTSTTETKSVRVSAKDAAKLIATGKIDIQFK